MSFYKISKYENKLSLIDTQLAIKLAKDTFTAFFKSIFSTLLRKASKYF